MSGICAVWRTDGSGGVGEALASLGGGMSPLGKENFRRESDAEAGVAVSARFETQQVYRNERVLIACDAELYNEDELRELVGAGNIAAGNSKTAAMLAALYERFGSDFPSKLRGAFSMIVWDRRERTLLGAVDGVGMKRLVYYRDGRVLLVASRIDGLIRSGEVSREINPRAVANVLNFSVSLAPETIFRKVHRLIPGAMLIASDRQVRVEKYWDMRYYTGGDSNEARLARQLESVVESSVEAHCKRDSFSTIGAFLSGGTDSSTVTGLMARTGRGTVQTFSIGFQEQPFNELEYAEIAARRFGTNHRTYLVGPDDCFDAIPDMVRSFDEPFGNSSAIPTYFCARLAAENGVKALLAGDGGDELFGGNAWYAGDRMFDIYQSVPAVLRKRLIEPVLARVPVQNGLVGKARNYIRRSNIPALERVLSYHFLCAHPPANVFDGDFLKALEDYSVLDMPSQYYREAPARDHLDRLLYMDVRIVLGDSDLPKVTRMAELAGIQARFPFLDRSVAEFSGSIPANLKVKRFQKRYLFKRAFRRLLPVEIIRKKKHGFGIPVAMWLKSVPRFRELARDTLLSRRTFERGYFRRDFIEDLFRKHEADDSSYYGDTLWTFLALELWHHQAVDEPARAAV
jgi:asparagine synthase (glutamine-hydrolysing)